jgi:hypothetical protein
LEGLAMEDVGTFYRFWSILRPFDILYVHSVYFVAMCMVYFSSFWYIVLRKIWQPWFQAEPIYNSYHKHTRLFWWVCEQAPINAAQTKVWNKKFDYIHSLELWARGHRNDNYVCRFLFVYFRRKKWQFSRQTLFGHKIDYFES